MPLTVDLVQLSAIPMHPYMQKIIDSGVRKHFKDYDAQRISWAFSKAKVGERCLEVGPGRRDLTALLSRSGLYGQVIAIDIEDQSAKMPHGVDFRVMSVDAMDFPDDHFDSVFCMEVLEHLNDAALDSAIRELRRVCRGQLLVTVPFREPANSKYHEQQFSEARIRNLFPAAKASLLIKEPNWRVPWVAVEEDHSD